MSDYWKHWENSETQNNFRFKETSGRHPAQPSAQSKASFNFRFDCPGYSLVKFCQNSIMKILQSLWALLRYFEIIMENYFPFNPDDNQLGFEIPTLYWGWWASQFLSYHVVHNYNPCLLGLTDSVRNHNKSLAMVYNFHCSCLVCKTESPIPLQKTGVSGIICPCYTDRCPWSVHHVPRGGFSKDITFHGIKVRLFGLCHSCLCWRWEEHAHFSSNNVLFFDLECFLISQLSGILKSSFLLTVPCIHL